MSKFTLILICIVVLLNSITVFGEENAIYSFEVYEISKESFATFIESPARKTVESQGGYMLSKYRKSNKTGYIQREVINLQFNTVHNQEAMSGIFRMAGNSYPAYTTTLERFGTNESVVSFLKELGMECVVSDYFFVCTWEAVPMSVWCETDKGVYFITIVFNTYSLEYDYYLYSAEQYYEKYRAKSGKLFINGIDVTEDNYVMFEGNAFFVPFRTIVEKLGHEVEWNEEYPAALFYADDVCYALNPTKFEGIIPLSDINQEHYRFTSDYDFIKNGRIILSNYGFFGKLMSLLGVNYSVDYDNAEIHITSRL